MTAKQEKKVESLDHTFEGVVEVYDEWHVIDWPGSKKFFGTGRTVKVEAVIDGKAEITTSFMPNGKGDHMLPLNAKAREEIGKGEGDMVKVHLKKRL